MNTDFLGDDEIGLRDHSESKILTPITNPNNQGEKPRINLVRNDAPEGQTDFL